MPAKKTGAKTGAKRASATKKSSTSSSRKNTASGKKSGGSARKSTGTKSSGAKKSGGAATKRSSRSRTADRTHINVNQAYELRDWSKELGVTPAQLRKVVREHGTGVSAVRKAITSSKKRSRSEDRSRVNVHQPYELRYWTKTLGTTADRLKELVKEHGPSAKGIRSALGMS